VYVASHFAFDGLVRFFLANEHRVSPWLTNAENRTCEVRVRHMSAVTRLTRQLAAISLDFPFNTVEPFTFRTFAQYSLCPIGKPHCKIGTRVALQPKESSATLYQSTFRQAFPLVYLSSFASIFLWVMRASDLPLLLGAVLNPWSVLPNGQNTS